MILEVLAHCHLTVSGFFFCENIMVAGACEEEKLFTSKQTGDRGK